MAGRYDLHIDQGSTFTRTFIYKNSDGTPIDITGYTPSLMIRRSHNAAGEPIYDDTSAAGTLTIPTGTDGKIELTMTDEDTAAMPAPTEAVWDLEIDLAGVITRIVEGAVFVSPNVTRADT